MTLRSREAVISLPISLSSSMLSFCSAISAACARISWVRSLTVASRAFAWASSAFVLFWALVRSYRLMSTHPVPAIKTNRMP